VHASTVLSQRFKYDQLVAFLTNSMISKYDRCNGRAMEKDNAVYGIGVGVR
jgi:hypothetical protein